MIRGHTDLRDLTERVSALQRSDNNSPAEPREQREQTKACFLYAERRVRKTIVNRGSSEGSVNLFRHCRVVTEEDGSQSADSAEKLSISWRFE